MTDASPDRVKVAFYVPMPLNAAGDGPADSADTVRVEHQVWDAATNETLCTARDEATAKRITEALSAAPRPIGEARRLLRRLTTMETLQASECTKPNGETIAETCLRLAEDRTLNTAPAVRCALRMAHDALSPNGNGEGER